METQRIEMDERRSVLVWDRDLPVPFGFVPVPFLHALGTEPVSFGTKEFQIQFRSVLVIDAVQVVELKQDGDEEERRKPSAITKIDLLFYKKWETQIFILFRVLWFLLNFNFNHKRGSAIVLINLTCKHNIQSNNTKSFYDQQKIKLLIYLFKSRIILNLLLISIWF